MNSQWRQVLLHLRPDVHQFSFERFNFLPHRLEINFLLLEGIDLARDIEVSIRAPAWGGRIARKHGQPRDIPGSVGERHADQRPITEEEIRSIPIAWRTPTRMEWSPDSLPRLQDLVPEGWAFGALRTVLEIDGRIYLGQYVADLPSGVLRVGSMWVKKEGGQP